MPGVREFFDTPAGKGVGGVFVLIAIGAAAYAIFGNGGNAAPSMASDRMFVDAKTNQPYEYTLQLGDKMPVKSPSGQAGYPAEACFWTKDGKVKSTPTYVLLNASLGKPGPTFCPDCGRLVVGHNPLPSGPNAKAPPTKEEYAARHADSSPDAAAGVDRNAQ